MMVRFPGLATRQDDFLIPHWYLCMYKDMYITLSSDMLEECLETIPARRSARCYESDHHCWRRLLLIFVTPVLLLNPSQQVFDTHPYRSPNPQDWYAIRIPVAGKQFIDPSSA